MVAAAACGLPDWDAVADGDLLRADEDVFDQQAQDPPAFFGAGAGGLASELGEESFQVIGELKWVAPLIRRGFVSEACEVDGAGGVEGFLGCAHR